MHPTGFYLKDGALYCDSVLVNSLLERELETPFFLYSTAQLRENLAAYQRATSGLNAITGYAIKANHNLSLCKLLAQQGAGAVVVSIDELRLALRAGFSPDTIWMHGNGKRRKDIEAALQHKVLLSADSLFDLEHISAAAKEQSTVARVMLRVNPDIDAKVHPYISTGMKESKFGLSTNEVAALSPTQFEALSICGLHCHLGSTLRERGPFTEATLLLIDIANQMKARGFAIDTLDIGGGLAIDYERTEDAKIPTPTEMLAEVYGPLQASGFRILLEPGRSLVGNVGALIGSVIGIKQTEAKRFLVTDASMVQLIRPALYEAYHHIVPLLASNKPEGTFDVVGPICESGDFLAKDRRLREMNEGEGIAILDAGAYGAAMSSRYNLHLFCAEYAVHEGKVLLIRRQERFEDLCSYFVEEACRFAQ